LFLAQYSKEEAFDACFLSSVGPNQWPLVWLEVHQDVEVDYFIELMDFAKTISCDAGVANVVISVEARMMALVFATNHGKKPQQNVLKTHYCSLDTRRRIAYIPPFTVEEANTYLDNLQAFGHRKLNRDFTFARLGTLPGSVSNFSVCTHLIIAGDLYSVVVGSAAALDEKHFVEGTF
jgi:hypothetical protein